MKILKPLNHLKIVSRWIIFMFDIAVSAIAFVFSYILYHNFKLDTFSTTDFATAFLFCTSLTAVSFFVFRLYSGIVRYTSAVDSIRILSTIVFTSILMFLVKLILIAFGIHQIIPTNLIIIYSLFAFTGLTTYRTCVKIFFQYTKSTTNGRKSAAVYGAGDLGIAVKRTFEHDFRSEKYIVAFIDDNEEKIGKVIDGIRIYASSDFQRIIDKFGIDELIIASSRIDIETKNAVIDQALEHNINVLTLPPVSRIMNGDLSPAQIKKIKIEELLERAPIQISNQKLLGQLQGKRVLVTGAAGSIGSEIAKQLSQYEPQMIILCDQAESPLHNLQLDLQDQFKNQIYHTLIADIRSEERMRELFQTFKPHYVYHAAAYKHVPMMENHPTEGVKTNVFGTQLLANLSVEFDVAKFVFISTDKAVNPTNVMGATKRIAEKYVQTLNNHLEKNNDGKGTKFITTRFGNVLGSNGSVIPRFRDQIEKGGPVTVTHPDITRYFMTIPEACQLVLEAGNMGNGGEIFVFDMGKSVKIVDLAKKMIKLSGHTPFKDIDIKFTGLRPGEKLYEELLNDLENTTTTHHDKIMIAKVRENDFTVVTTELTKLLTELQAQNTMNVVRQMKVIVPEFKSQNSIYEQLDKEKTEVINTH